MRILLLLPLIFLLPSCGRNDLIEAERELIETLKAERLKEQQAVEQAAERERDERLAKIPPFVDLGDTVNFTDENGWKQGIWKIRVEGLDEFEITPTGATEALQLDGKVREIRQYYNDTLHGIYKSFDMFNNFRLCVKGKYILGKKDGLWEYPCIRKDSTFKSVYDLDW